MDIILQATFSRSVSSVICNIFIIWLKFLISPPTCSIDNAEPLVQAMTRRRIAIIWTKDNICHWRIYASLYLYLSSYCSLQWRQNEREGISNHLRLDCLQNRLFRRRSKTSKLHITGLCEENPPVTGGFPAQRTSNVKNVSIRWRHNGYLKSEH